MSLTERQARAAGAPGGVAITAGAGTGKTHTLGHRYLQHLRDGLSPLEIVAVTFTERAAHELRARVRAYARRELGPEDARLAELEAAPIGTVHGLCLRICRDHPDAAGVPHDVGVLDPLHGATWLAERLEPVLADVPAELFERMPYERVRETLATLARDPYRAEGALARGPEGWPELVETARRAAFDAWLGGPEVAEAEATLAALSGPEADKGEAARGAALAALAAARAGDVDAASAHVKGYRTNAGSKKVWGEDQATLQAAITVVKRAVEGWRDDPRADLALGPTDDALAELLPALREAFEAVRDGLAAAKRRRRVLDFGDLEVHALRALDDPEVRAHYAERWRALLVDEVQDTSPVQEAIVEHLAGFCRTTVVGDEKQSIYGFRGADERVFGRMAAAVEAAGGARVELDVSFRTHAALVDAANEAFADLLGPLHGPLSAHRRAAPGPGPHLRRLVLEGAKGVSSDVRRLAEARRIAGEIERLLAAGTPVHDEDAPGGVRPARASDVAVLARSWAPLDLLVEILPAAGVPAVHTGGGDLLETREARDAEAALRFLADPHDDVALVAILRGPFFAVSDEVLAGFAEACPPAAEGAGPTSWWARLDAVRPAELARPREVLAELLAARDEPPSRLLARLDRATGWSAVVANLPGGPRRAADLEGFVELVRELERSGGDVFGVARTLRRLRLAGTEVARPALEADDAVTLTTIHGSKGLEWPIVVLAALDAGGGGSTPAVRFDEGLGAAVRFDDEHERNAAPALWTLLGEAERAREEAEDRRLLYVALTRARDYAIVTAAARSRKGTLLDLLAPSLDRAGVAEASFAYDPEAATWPDPPLPPARPEGEGSDLWRAEVAPAAPEAAPHRLEDFLEAEAPFDEEAAAEPLPEEP